MEEIVTAVRKAFGRPEMSFEDIYNHLVLPKILFLLENRGQVLGMAAYSYITDEILFVDGIAIDPSMQRYGIFSEITDLLTPNSIICLKTQNPHMYRAIEKYCSQIFPSRINNSRYLRKTRDDIARRRGYDINRDGVIERHYGHLLYGEKPHHPKVSPFFENVLRMNVYQGDSLLVVGEK